MAELWSGRWAAGTSLFVALTLLAACAGEHPAPPRHVLLITVDTLRADHLGSYGYPRPTSPNIDRLAASGTRFANAITHAPLTLPAHSSLLTGTLPATHGARTNWEALAQNGIPTLAEMARERGFHTAAVVAGFVLNRRFGLDRGFDHYDDQFQSAYRTADQVVARADAWLRQRSTGAPFFLWLHFMDPHAPYAPPGFGDPDQVAELERIRVATVLGQHTPTPEQIGALKTLYDAEIRYADHAVGNVLALLDELGLRDQTLLALTADHGEGFAHDYFFDHGDRLYDEQLHVPLILAHPGTVPSQLTVASQVRLVDVLPTIIDLLDWTDDPPDRRQDGVSLRPLLLSAADGQDTQAISQTYLRRAKGYRQHRELASDQRSAGTLSSLRSRRYKLIRTDFTDGREPRLELYALASDPHEQRDIAGQQADVLSTMDRMLQDYLRAAGPIAGHVDPTLTEDELEKLRALGYAGP